MFIRLSKILTLWNLVDDFTRYCLFGHYMYITICELTLHTTRKILVFQCQNCHTWTESGVLHRNCIFFSNFRSNVLLLQGGAEVILPATWRLQQQMCKPIIELPLTTTRTKNSTIMFSTHENIFEPIAYYIKLHLSNVIHFALHKYMFWYILNIRLSLLFAYLSGKSTWFFKNE